MNKMNKIILFILVPTISFSYGDGGWDNPCTIPDGKVKILNPYQPNTLSDSTHPCSITQGIYYVCYTNNENHDVRILNPDIEPDQNNMCTFETGRLSYIYSDDNCGENAFLSTSGNCECTFAEMIYDSAALSCNCPESKVWNGDFCEDSCSPLLDPWQFSAATEANCNVATLQAGYAEQNPDSLLDVGSVSWHCDNKCYVMMVESNDNNTTDGTDSDSSNGDTNTTDGTDGNNNPDGDFISSNDIYGVNGRLQAINSSIKSSSSLAHADQLRMESKIESNSNQNHNDLMSLKSSIDFGFDNLLLSNNDSGSDDSLNYNALTLAINNLSSKIDDINGTGGLTGFNDSRIVQANIDTKEAVENLSKLLTENNETLDNYDESKLDLNLTTGLSDIYANIDSYIADINITSDDLKNEISSEFGVMVDGFETNATGIIDDLVIKIFTENIFNPFDPFIEIGQHDSNFVSIPFIFDISAFDFHSQVDVDINILLGDQSDENIQLMYSIIQTLFMFAAVIFGFLYLVGSLNV